MTVNGVIAVILRYFTKFVYDVFAIKVHVRCFIS